MNNEYPVEKNNYLRKEIMPKREGSGPAGTKELLGVMGAVPAAAMAASPIGRGLMGIAGSMAANTSDSEAGFFKVRSNMGAPAPGWSPHIRSSAFKNGGKTNAYGNQTLKRTIHMKDGSRISGKTASDTFYGYDKNGVGFTLQGKYLVKMVDDIKTDTQAGKDMQESIKAYMLSATK